MVPGMPTAQSKFFKTYDDRGIPYLITNPLYPLSETSRLLPPPRIKKGTFLFFAHLTAFIISSLFLATKKYLALPPMRKVVYFAKTTFLLISMFVFYHIFYGR